MNPRLVSDSPLAVGLIGPGKHGSRYAKHLIHDCPELRLAAIARRSTEGADQARQWSCTWYQDWQELIAAPEVEAVIAVVPPVHHPAIARACAAFGKPLLLEKPLACTQKEGQAIAGLCQSGALQLTMAQTLRYNPIVQALKDSFHLIGNCYAFSAGHRLEPSTLSWLEDPQQAGAGVVLHTAIHLFDALRFISGQEIGRVRATLRRVHNPRLDDLFMAEVELGAATGMVMSSKVGPGRSGRYEFIGELGELHGDQIHQRLEFIQGTDITSLDHAPPAMTLLPLLRDWQAHLCHGRPNPIPVEDGLAALAACSSCISSASDERWVTVPHP